MRFHDAGLIMPSSWFRSFCIAGCEKNCVRLKAQEELFAGRMERTGKAR